jgi:predicted Zn-dependent protease
MGAGQVWTDLVTSGYSRKLETHADEQGLEFLVAAGFDPNQALPAFEELRIKDDDEVNLAKVWSSHPDIDSRLSNLKKQIKKIDLPPSYIPEASDYVEKYGNAMLVDAKLNILGQHYDQADKVLSSYLKYKKDEPLAYYLLGENLRKRSPDGPGFSNRIEAYTRAVSLDQNFAPAYKELGMVYRQQGENAKAADSLLQYLALEPDSIDAPIISWYVAQLGGSQGGQK